MEKKNLLLPDVSEDWTQAGDSMAAAMEKAEKAFKALTATAGQAKRMLMGFDQINRLGEKKKSGTSRKNSKKEEASVQKDTPQVQNAITLQQVLEELDTAVLERALGLLPGLSNTIAVVRQTGQQLFDTWQNQLLPVGQWVEERLIPAVGQNLGGSIRTAWDTVNAFAAMFSQCWQTMQASSDQAAWMIGEKLLGMGDAFETLVIRFFGGSKQLGSGAEAMALGVCSAVGTVTEKLYPLQGGWSAAMGDMQSSVAGMAGGACNALKTVTDYLQGSFSQQWQAGFTGLKAPAKGAFNGVIGFMNKVLSGMGGTVNGMVNTLNSLKIKIPDWVPVLGGKQYSLALKTVTTPDIPYLAKGAVLPANQPFLAVLGDQKHGTNIEAPLATIQEAVAAVMADHTAGNMAGHEATVAVLNQILAAVLGIDVSEAVIARAAQSYAMKETVMKGGGL